MLVFLFLLLLILIFLVSGKITSGIYSICLKIFRNSKWGIYILSFLLLPGTIVHELSHFLIATILRVPTGKISVIPYIEGETLKTGHMEMAKTDPFRHTLIGFAPLMSGLTIIYFTGKYFLHFTMKNPISDFQFLTSLIAVYIIFIMSLTMFTSKKDLDGFKIAAPILIVAYIAMNISGIKIILSSELVEKINLVISVMNVSLGIAAATDLFVLIFVRTILKLFRY